MKRAFLVSCTTIFLLLSGQSIYACTCSSGVLKEEGRAPDEELRRFYLEKFDGALFVGEVTRIEKAKAEGGGIKIPVSKVTMRVEKFWRGVESAEVSIFTYYGRGGCGVSYVLGEKYFVFAQNLKWGLTTDSCTDLDEKEASEFMKFLGEGRSFPATAKPNNPFNRTRN